MESFIFYETFEEQLALLDDATALKFYKAISAYGLYDILPDFAGLELAAWIPIQRAIECAKERRNTNQKNGKRGGRPKKDEPKEEKNESSKPNKTETNQKEPSKNLNVNGNVYDNDNVNGGGVMVGGKTTTTNYSKKYTEWLKEHDFIYDSSFYDKIASLAGSKGVIWLEYILDCVKKRYPSKTHEEYRRLFCTACSWPDLEFGFDSWVSKQKRQELANKKVYNSKIGVSYRICPQCGAKVPGTLTVCPQCYADV